MRSNVIHWPRHMLEYTDSGLAMCRVCGGAEGSIPDDCPGEYMCHEVQDLVYEGEVDFRRRHGGWTLWTRDKEMKVRRQLT